VEEVDAIIEAVPYLMDPVQLVQSLADLQRWFPSQVRGQGAGQRWRGGRAAPAAQRL
jgi:hypothetical protein